MKMLEFRGILGWVGTALSLGACSPMAIASPVESLPHFRLAQAQSPVLGQSCRAEQSQVVETQVRSLLEQARQQAAIGQLEASAQNTFQALRVAQQLQDSQLKIVLLEEVTSLESQSGLFSLLIQQALEAQSRTNLSPEAAQAIATAMTQALQTTQTLTSGYSAAKTRNLVAIATHYGRLGESLLASNVLSQALQASQWIQGAEFKALALTSIAQTYLDIGQTDPVSSLLDQAFQAAQAVNNPNPSRRGQLLELIATAYAEMGQNNRALQIAQTMTDAPYYQALAQSAVVKNYLRAAQLDAALQIAQAMTASDVKAPLLTEVASAFADAGQGEQAAEIFADAVAVTQTGDTPEGRAYSLSVIVLDYAEAGYQDAALVAAEALEPGYTKALTLGKVALTYGGDRDQAKGLIAETIAMLQAIPDAGERSRAIDDLLDATIKANEFELATEIAQVIEFDSADEYLFNRADALFQIARKALEAEQYEAAYAIAQAMQGSFYDYRNQIFSKAAIGYAEAGQFNRALEITQAFDYTPSDYQVQTLAAIATQYQRADQPERATELFDQAIATAREIDPVGRVNALTAIAVELFQAGEADRARVLLDEAVQTAAAEQSAESRTFALAQIADRLLATQQLALATEVIAQMPDDDPQKQSKLMEVISQAIAANENELALMAAEQIGAADAKARWLITIADEWAQSGQTPQAESVLARAIEVTQTVSGPEVKTLVVRSDYDGEGNVISQLEVEDDNDRGSLYEDIALSYLALGQYQQVVAVAQRLESDALRSQLLQRLACLRSL